MLKEPGLVLAMITLWGIVAQWVSWWLRIPAILFLLIIRHYWKLKASKKLGKGENNF